MSKRWAPKVSLAALIVAPMLADILWPVFLLMGVEHVRIVPGWTPVNALDPYHMPWSHSLLMLVVWGALFGLVTARLARSRTAGWVVFAGVLSHWLLDWISHKYDMPLWPGGAGTGLYLWRSAAATLAVEIALYAVGVRLWLNATRARNRKGSIGSWVFVVVLVILYLAGFKAPPPPDAVTIAVSALVFTLVLLPLVWWLDRQREAA